MSSAYDPDDSATLVPPWNTAFRSQRDVALRIPVNYVTVAAVSLRAACFSHNRYEDVDARKCISNLLASGFKRFSLDLYWDAGRSVWSLCPVEIPESASHSDDSTSDVLVPSTSATALQSAQITARGVPLYYDAAAPTSRLWNEDLRLFERLESTSSSSSLSSASASTSASYSFTALNATNSTTSSSVAPSPTKFPTGGEPLIEIGPYNCTSTIGFSTLADVLAEYLSDTGNTLDAMITYLILNIHAAAPYSSPLSPARQPDSADLPGSDNLLDHIVSANLSSYLFTPSMLQDDRADLNSSWYNVAPENDPAPAYFTTETNDKDIVSSPDGWPTETYMEFKHYLRLIASFGSIDPQMAAYNLTADYGTVFPPESIRSIQDVSISPSGTLTSGCLFDPNSTSVLTAPNSSFALAAAPSLPPLGPDPNTTLPIPAVTNLTACGISPFLNTTLANTPASADSAPYLAFAHSTLWSWAPSEPANDTTTLCAALYGGSSGGRWRATDCTAHHRAACRSTTSPYTWHLTPSLVTYAAAPAACPPNTSFATPRTALENSHLYAAVLAAPAAAPTDPDDVPVVFLSLNSRDLAGCWVVGANATCPYRPPESAERTRVVVVPTLAAVVVFVLAVLTLFVKCAANRRDGRRGRRRRNVGGWDYEGVPS